MKRILIPVAVIAIASFMVWWLSPIQVVKRRTGQLIDTITLSEGSGAASRHFNSLTLSKLLASEISLETPEIEASDGEYGRDQIESGFAWLTTQAKYSTFEIEEFQAIEVNGDRAKVVARIEGIVVLPSYRPVDGRYEVDFRWRRADDGWRLEKAVWRKLN